MELRPSRPPVAALIEEALAVCRVLPPYERLVELDQQLRAELANVTPIVQKEADGMNHGTAQWHARQRGLNAVKNALVEDLGDGFLSAATHVQELGRRVLELNGYTGDGDSNA